MSGWSCSLQQRSPAPAAAARDANAPLDAGDAGEVGDGQEAQTDEVTVVRTNKNGEARTDKNRWRLCETDR